MSVSSGFFNARNHDRRYDAVQISSMFDGLINDGVYNSYGTYFMVNAQSGMTVTVGIGRAWFDHSWILNDAIKPIDMGVSELFMNRIDAIVIETNHDLTIRENTIKIVKGTPATQPVRPTLVNTEDVHQYPLCYIYIGAGVTTITQANITNMVGTSACPFVNGLIEKVTTDQLLTQWRAEWEEWSPQYQQEFADWVAGLHDVLDSEVAGHLQLEIESLQAATIMHTNQITALNTQLPNGLKFVKTTEAAKGTDANTMYCCYQ